MGVVSSSEENWGSKISWVDESNDNFALIFYLWVCSSVGSSSMSNDMTKGFIKFLNSQVRGESGSGDSSTLLGIYVSHKEIRYVVSKNFLWVLLINGLSHFELSTFLKLSTSLGKGDMSFLSSPLVSSLWSLFYKTSETKEVILFSSASLSCRKSKLI